jgi:hypothetical protein
MPVLSNPRYERFAQALFAGLAGKTRQERAHSTAYLAAYPSCSPGKNAGAAAARLLARVSPILDRVKELQAEQTKRTMRKVDISRERIARRLDLASTIAEEERNPAAIVSSELGIAKIFGLELAREADRPDLSQAKSMTDLGRRLLISVGLQNPDDASIALAVEANDAFVARLESIRDAARGTVDEEAHR